MKRLTVLLPAMVLLAATLLEAQSSRNPETQKIADAFVAAWAKGDAQTIAALHAENAIRSTPEGVIYAGRAAIEKAFAESFAGPLKGTMLIVKPGEERTIAPDVVVLTGTYEITGGKVPAGAVTKGIYVNTAVRQGGRWLLASGVPVGATAPTAPPKPQP